MAEGLLIQVGADVNGAIAGLQKIGLSLSQAEKRFAELIETTGDFDAALVKLSKEGGVSINFLEKEIKDFKQAFGNATDPAQAKKFGDALQILQLRQKELINTGLSVADTSKKINESHGSATVATQRLSASFLGLSKVFDVLPPEIAHLTHGFDQIFESFERTSHGTESAGDALKKFAGALGQAGLGIAIGVAVGLIADLIKELYESSKGFTEAELAAAAFRQELEEIDKSLKERSTISDFTAQIAKLQAQIRFGSGFRANIVGDQEELKNNAGKINAITEEVDKLIESFASLKRASPFQGLSEKGKELVENLFPTGQNVDKGLLGTLEESDKAFVTELSDLNSKIAKLQDDRQALQLKNKLIDQDILLQQADEARKALKKAFEQIKAGYVEGTKDLVHLLEMNPNKLSLPFQVALDENKLTTKFSALNEQLRAKLNEFALKASSIPLTIQQQINVDPNIKLPPNIRDDIEARLRSQFSSDTPLQVDATGHLNLDIDGEPQIDTKKLGDRLNTAAADVVQQLQVTLATGIGEAFGDALSGKNIDDAFSGIVSSLADAVKSLGVELIKTAAIFEGFHSAIASLADQPEIALALGIAMVALSQVMKNKFSKRELGGPVQQGFSYLVNERGQEAFLTNSGKLSMIEGGMQNFTPWESGKILPAGIAKAFAQKFKLPRFEFGGLVSGPTFGLLGEGAGISRFNPEVIAPLHSLKGLLGGGGQSELKVIVEGRVDGSDILLSNARENKKQGRGL